MRLILFLLQSLIFDEVDLSDASVAESSTKNVNNSFTVRASHTRTHQVKLLLEAGKWSRGPRGPIRSSRFSSAPYWFEQRLF